MKAVCISQARMTSTRFPGKVLEPLAGKTVLAHALERCARIPGIDEVVCATVDDPSGDPVAEEAVRVGASVFRGSTTDVLSRYLGAAQMSNADIVMRITSDCPLTDPELDGDVLKLYLASGVDYACNNMPRAFPHGLDCEVFSFASLERAAKEDHSAEGREHVTPFLRTQPSFKREVIVGPDEAYAAWRWTVDYPEDLENIRAQFGDALMADPFLGWRELAEFASRSR